MDKNENKNIRIAIAEDHDIVRKGMVTLLKKEPKISVIFDVSNGKELLDHLSKEKIDIVLLDLDMPVLNGKQTLKHLSKDFPKVKAIILSMYTDEDIVMEMLKEGAAGYLPKNCTFDEAVDAIFNVKYNGNHASNIVTKTLFNQLQKPTFNSIQKAKLSLTEKETEVLTMICDGKSSEEIANNISLSKKMIDAIRSKLLEKLEANNTASLIRKSILLGLYIPKTDEQISEIERLRMIEKEMRRNKLFKNNPDN